MTGKFIVFEGLDGSGTSTQASLLQKALIEAGSQAYLTSEPTNGPVGGIIRLMMRHRLNFSSDSHAEDRQLAYLFAADRHDHLYNDANGVVPLLESGATVISTRYYLSSYAYHASCDEDLDAIHRLNADFPAPDLTFFLDCPVETCIQRISASRSKPEKYETARKLEVVSHYYAKALDRYPGVVHRIDASRAEELVHSDVLALVRS